jgi:hypothetical protein
MLPRRNHVALWVALLLALLFAVALPAAAASNNGKHPPSMFAYDKAHEITFNGTISQVVSHPAKGSVPLGMHMMVVSDGITRDVHLGSYLPKEVTQNVLRPNQPVQIVGVNMTLNGKPVVLARQVITGGRQITVRNENGFLVMQGTKNPGRTLLTAKGGR